VLVKKFLLADLHTVLTGGHAVHSRGELLDSLHDGRHVRRQIGQTALVLVLIMSRNLHRLTVMLTLHQAGVDVTVMLGVVIVGHRR
jgi:hypothetical protein